MALIFLGVLIVFYHFKFRVSTSQIALTSSLMVSGPNSPKLNSLDYQVWGQCWSLNKTCNRSQNQFPSFKMHFLNFVCVTGESYWQHCERLPPPTSGMCVSQ